MNSLLTVEPKKMAEE